MPIHRALIISLAVGIGGAIGALTRLAVGMAVDRLSNGVAFPIATLLINVTGSAFLGWFYTIMNSRPPSASVDLLKLAIGTGFVGAYTTFSTYMFETTGLLSRGATFTALAYLFGSLALGLLGVWLGVRLASV